MVSSAVRNGLVTVSCKLLFFVFSYIEKKKTIIETQYTLSHYNLKTKSTSETKCKVSSDKHNTSEIIYL